MQPVFFRNSQHHTRELTILSQVAAALNREVDLQRALNTALVSIVELFALKTGWIFLLDEQGKFYTAATLHLPPALADHPRRMGGTCYCLDSFEDGEMAGADNIDAIICSRLKDLKMGTEGLRYHASIPLYAQDKPLGVLNVASPDWRKISRADLRLLHTVGDLMSMAIQRTRLFRQSAELGAIEERNRLARDIHDTLAQGLSAIILQLETADAHLETSSPPNNDVHVALQKALALARENLAEARCSVQDLRATPLEGKTLAQALRELLSAHAADTAAKTQLEVIGSAPPISVRVEIGLYRIAQEALTNIQRHTQAQQVDVQLILTPERVRLVIEDDGRGFDVYHIPVGHYGLLGIRERARLLNGRVDIASTPGTGTIIEVTVPLDRAE